MLDILKPKEVGVWAVVFNNQVIDTYVGHPELYNSPFPEDIDISLVQCSSERGKAKIGNTWNGDKFINV